MSIVEVEGGYKVDPEAGVIIGKRGQPVGAPDRRGYIQVFRMNGRRHSPMAHRVIWEAVHGPIPDGHEINHKNGVKTDNRIANLELVTRGENIRHAYAMGLRRSRKGTFTCLPMDKVHEVRIRVEVGESKAALAREYGVSRTTITNIVNKECA